MNRATRKKKRWRERKINTTQMISVAMESDAHMWKEFYTVNSCDLQPAFYPHFTYFRLPNEVNYNPSLESD